MSDIINPTTIASRIKILFLCCLVVFLFIPESQAQEEYRMLEQQLDSVSSEIPALNEVVSISVTNVSIQEFLRGVANNSGLNIDVSPELDQIVVNNFTNVRVKDILVFICRQYDLELAIIGNIISVYQQEKPEIFVPTDFAITYDSVSRQITLDYRNQELGRVAREVTRLTGNNLILAPGLSRTMVSGYVQNMPFDNALEKFLFANNLKLTRTDDDFYVIERMPEEQKPEQQTVDRSRPGMQQGRNTRNDQQSDEDYTLEVRALGNDSINVFAINTPLQELVQALGDKLQRNFFLTSPLEGQVTLRVNRGSFEDILKYALSGTVYSYTRRDNIYLIGEDTQQDLRDFRVIQLQHRSIETVIDLIPETLAAGASLSEFPDLNSLLVSGTPKQIEAIQHFLNGIDKIVPVILIEIIIVDVNKKFIVSTGISAGLGDEPVQTGGTIFPGIDIDVGADAINRVLNSNALDWVNMGNINPNFYMRLRAMEEQGILKVRSTPKLSTLNGHEATLTIGNTEYYVEEQSNIITGNNPIESTSQVYKSLEAQLAITLKPFVSGDDHITLEVDVQQSDFTERISPTAPPGAVSRTFNSLIRVKNQEMVLLGGLEEKRVSDSGTGTPLLSRIPVIKWFFSSRTKESGKARLNIFIRPTIIS